MDADILVKRFPERKDAVDTASPETGLEYTLSKDGVWAKFYPLMDGAVRIRTCVGKYEDELHGECFPSVLAYIYASALKQNGFISQKKGV